MSEQDVLELSRQEILQRIDRGARRRLGLSAEEFIAAYRTGRLKDCGAVADLLMLAQLLSKDDPLFVAA